MRSTTLPTGMFCLGAGGGGVGAGGCFCGWKEVGCASGVSDAMDCCGVAVATGWGGLVGSCG